MKSFCYFGDGMSANGGSEAAVTARSSFGEVKFKECGYLLRGRKLS